jgi:glycosyltransferase involved in cell wall biosynthesis
VLKSYWQSANGKAVDAVLAHRLRMAPAAFMGNPGKPVVLELTDSLIGYTGQLKGLKGAPLSRKLAARWDYWFLKSEEVDWVKRSAQSTVISAQDENILLENGAPLEKVQVVPNGVSPIRKVSSKIKVYPKGRPVVCFVGNMGYAPNEEGALWFLKNVWPWVKTHVPTALFAAVGGSPREKLKKYHDGQNILVTGWVPEVAPYFTQATLSVAPLRVASGMQNKVAQALSLGVPVVATSQAAAWMGPQGKVFVEEADGEGAFAQKVVGILKNPRKARLKAAKGKRYILKTYRWENSGWLLENILKQATKET